jgi:hypothetical protein
MFELVKTPGMFDLSPGIHFVSFTMREMARFRFCCEYSIDSIAVGAELNFSSFQEIQRKF